MFIVFVAFDPVDFFAINNVKIIWSNVQIMVLVVTDLYGCCKGFLKNGKVEL